jgi:hypothetical protein
VYVLDFDLKPITTNGERAGNRWVRADSTKQWRMLGALYAVRQRIPQAEWLSVVVIPHQQKGRLQDVAACNPSVKAVIDGIVDAGVIPDDSGKYVREIRFLPPDRSRDGLTVKLVLKSLTNK